MVFILKNTLLLIFLFSSSILFSQELKVKEMAMPGGEKKYGVQNQRGKWFIPPAYDTIFFTSTSITGIGLVKNDTLRAGIIDHRHRNIIDPAYKMVHSEMELLFLLDFEGFYHCASTAGLTLHSGFKSYAFAGDTLITSEFPVWDVFHGNEILFQSVQADSIVLQGNQLAIFRNGITNLQDINIPDLTPYSVPSAKSCQTFDSIALPHDSLLKPYQKIFSNSEGFTGVVKDGYGFIDSSGKIRISLQYEDAQGFSEGLAPVKLIGKWGFIDANEELVIQPVFDHVFPFCDGLAVVQLNSKWNFIDKTGKLINRNGYDAIEKLNSGNWLLKENNKIGLAASGGRELIIPKYSFLLDYGNNFSLVSRFGKFGVLDYQQNIVVSDSYEKIVSPVIGLFFACKSSGKERFQAFINKYRVKQKDGD